jgi:hypothetical protein
MKVWESSFSFERYHAKLASTMNDGAKSSSLLVQYPLPPVSASPERSAEARLGLDYSQFGLAVSKRYKTNPIPMHASCRTEREYSSSFACSWHESRGTDESFVVKLICDIWLDELTDGQIHDAFSTWHHFLDASRSFFGIFGIFRPLLTTITFLPSRPFLIKRWHFRSVYYFNGIQR